MKTLRIIGKKGRITIPYFLRQQLGIKQGDVISFAAENNDELIVHKERLCNNCLFEKNNMAEASGPIFDILDSLSEAAKFDLLACLNERWATDQTKGDCHGNTKK